MKWFIVAILLVLPMAHAQTTDGGSVGTDSFLYKADLMWDNFLFKVGMKSADAIAKERYAEVEEAKLLGDIAGVEQGKEALKVVEAQITDEALQEDIQVQDEEITSSTALTTAEIMDALNDYEKIAVLVDGISTISVETEGLEEHIYKISIENGKISGIVEENITDVDIEIQYSEIVLAVHDEEYRDKKLDQLLRLKSIEQDKEALIEKIGG